MDKLKIIWKRLASLYTNNDVLIDELWTEIVTNYIRPERHYHNLMHLHYMTDKAVEYRDRIKDVDTLIFSIFYHDIIYNTLHQDNEQKSAEIAYNRLKKIGVPTEKIEKCKKQILATKYHANNIDNDTNYLVDFDLAILGESSEQYKDYTKKIRAEYSIYSDPLYNNGRKKVLQHFLGMTRIFKTEEFHKIYEQKARENLKTELEEL